ncbi:hypothetical protein [Caballeronia sp. Lep1P3]|uniref:hypothetical protein n=1 Tax=Caballeronia sp. Lep1P3 TaxID=2878150 RepID=UPI001FD4CFB4|nr:hypothetical protein [Caballeronia sp. Lep1P3]
MKQRHIQNFLMVSAAFFAISAPVGGARANASPLAATSVQHITQVRVPNARRAAAIATIPNAAATATPDPFA